MFLIKGLIEDSLFVCTSSTYRSFISKISSLKYLISLSDIFKLTSCSFPIQLGNYYILFLLRHRDRKSLRSPMPLGRTRILFFDADSSLICFRYINSEGSTSMLLESMLSFSSLFSCFMVLNYLSLLSAKLSVITLGNNFRIESTDSILFPTS